MKVIAYQVTAVRGDFRRCGRTFKRGVRTKVDATALTTVQAELLTSSNPRDLLVETVFAEPAACAPPAPAAARGPVDTGVIITATGAFETAGRGPADSGVIITAQAAELPEVTCSPPAAPYTPPAVVVTPPPKKGRGK